MVTILLVTKLKRGNFLELFFRPPLLLTSLRLMKIWIFMAFYIMFPIPYANIELKNYWKLQIYGTGGIVWLRLFRGVCAGGWKLRVDSFIILVFFSLMNQQ